MTAPGSTARRERLAAIDVGSNSVRLVIAELDPDAGLNIIDEVKDQPRLAAGLVRTGRLDEEAMARAMHALARMRDVCRRRGVDRLAAVATSAVREAANGAEFADRVRRELHIPLRVIDAETEARLSYRSVAHHFPLTGARTLVADIGGGSLELIGAVDGLVEVTTSLPFGAVRLTDLFLEEEDTRRAVRRLRAHVRRQLKHDTPLRSEWTGANVIGSGGTFTNLARMTVARRGHPVPQSVHGVTVGTADVEHLLEWLSTLAPEQRRSVPGLNPQRSDIILAGLAVTAELLDLVDARSLTASAFGLREGLLLEMAGAGSSLEPSDPLRLIREFAWRCQSDRRHVEQVRQLALQLFDQLGSELGADPAERALLEAAGLLHDVGQLVSYRRHHKHSYQLIMHAERLGLSARDRALVALISRYHRKSGPRKKHAEFAALPKEDRDLVRRLSGLLRVADGLDRGHTAIVERVSAEVTDERITVRAVPRLAEADLALECWGAIRKADVLAEVSGREIVVEPAISGSATS